MPNNMPNQKTDKVFFKILSGIILSLIFILFGYLINDAIGRDTAPTFENAFGKYVLLFFLGLISGYNIANSLQKGKSTYYFYAGLFTPIFILVLGGLIWNGDIASSLLTAFGLLFPIIFIYSGMVETHEKFKMFIELFAKYIPNLSVMTVAVGDYGLPIIELQFNTNLGGLNYAIGFIVAICAMAIIWFIDYLIKNRY
jgi:hypothetical protein